MFTKAIASPLINYQVAKSILELLVQNLVRLNESEETDRQGVFHILGECSPSLSSQLT